MRSWNRILLGVLLIGAVAVAGTALNLALLSFTQYENDPVGKLSPRAVFNGGGATSSTSTPATTSTTAATTTSPGTSSSPRPATTPKPRTAPSPTTSPEPSPSPAPSPSPPATTSDEGGDGSSHEGGDD